MSILSKLVSSFERKKIKRKTIAEVKKMHQHNVGVINLHRLDPSNTGDYYCAPHLYFDELKGSELDIFGYKSSEQTVREQWIEKVSNNALIVGGGGLLNREGFGMQLKLFSYLAKEKNKKVAIWGVGHNSPYKHQFGKAITYNVNLNAFGLVGIRDFSQKHNWVPCVSCMHNIFDQTETEVNEIGLVYHKKTLKDEKLLKKLAHFPSVSNKSSLEEMVGFIKKTNIVVTNSYHAMYWATLLEKKVLAIPNSTKFYDFKYMPAITSFYDFEKDQNKAQSYSGVLEECRNINKQYAHQVFDYVGL